MAIVLMFLTILVQPIIPLSTYGGEKLYPIQSCDQEEIFKRICRTEERPFLEVHDPTGVSFDYNKRSQDDLFAPLSREGYEKILKAHYKVAMTYKQLTKSLSQPYQDNIKDILSHDPTVDGWQITKEEVWDTILRGSDRFRLAGYLPNGRGEIGIMNYYANYPGGSLAPILLVTGHEYAHHIMLLQLMKKMGYLGQGDFKDIEAFKKAFKRPLSFDETAELFSPSVVECVNNNEYITGNKFFYEDWADFFASLVLESEIQKFSSRNDRLAYVQNSMSWACPLLKEGDAPVLDWHYLVLVRLIRVLRMEVEDGDITSQVMRIVRLFRQPNLRAALRCSGPPIEQNEIVRGCNLNGEISKDAYARKSSFSPKFARYKAKHQ